MNTIRGTVLSLLGIAACASLAPAQGPAVLRELPPVRLAEFVDGALTRPRGLALDPDGGVYVVDYAQTAVLRFDAHGRPVRRYGSRGNGPGELQSPGTVAVIGDSIVAITDARRRDISLFDRTSGRFVRRVDIPGSPGSVLDRRGELWVGAMNLAERTSVARIALRDGSTETGVAPPPMYTPGSPASLAHPFVHVIADGDAMVVGFAATDYLIVVQGDGRQDTAHVTRTSRRGIPRDLADRLTRLTGPGDYYTLLSTVVGLESVTRGVVLVAHTDLDVRPGATFETGPSAPDPFRYRVFVSLVRLRERQVCADVAVPVSGEVAPATALRADTLYIVDEDPSNDAAPWLVRRFHVQSAACTWQPARPRGF